MQTADQTDFQSATGYFDEVRKRRIMAFAVDYLTILLLTFVVGIAVFIFGLFTLGAGWLLFTILPTVVAVAYVGLTMGGPNQATPGMRMFALRIERLDGLPVDPFYAILHGILFWVFHITLTPILLIVSLFSDKKRLAQDYVLGTVVIRSDFRQ